MSVFPVVLPLPGLRILAAAVRLNNGMVITMHPPARHHTILHAMHKLGLPVTFAETKQGFLDNSGNFVPRNEARVIAERSGQLLPSARSREMELFTEDLW